MAIAKQLNLKTPVQILRPGEGVQKTRPDAACKPEYANSTRPLLRVRLSLVMKDYSYIDTKILKTVIIEEIRLVGGVTIAYVQQEAHT